MYNDRDHAAKLKSTEGSDNPATTTTTTDKDLDISRKVTRLRHYSWFSFARLPRCFPTSKEVPLHPLPSGSPTIAYFAYRIAVL